MSQKETIAYREMIEALDTRIGATLTSGKNIFYAGGIGQRSELTAESLITVADLRRGSRYLKRWNAIPFRALGGRFALVLDPNVSYDLFLNPEVRDYLDMSDVQIGPPFWLPHVGNFLNFAIFETTHLPRVDGNPIVYPSIFLGAGAVGVHPLDVHLSEMSLYSLCTSQWDEGVAILNQAHVVRLESTARP